jgi:hypothetical protein
MARSGPAFWRVEKQQPAYFAAHVWKERTSFPEIRATLAPSFKTVLASSEEQHYLAMVEKTSVRFCSAAIRSSILETNFGV